MAIKIIDDGPDIELTRKEYDILIHQWQASQKYTTFYQSFESYVREVTQNKQAYQGCFDIFKAGQ